MSKIKLYYFGPGSAKPEDIKIDDGMYSYVRYQDHLQTVAMRDYVLGMYDIKLAKLEAEVKELKAQRDASKWYPYQGD